MRCSNKDSGIDCPKAIQYETHYRVQVILLDPATALAAAVYLNEPRLLTQKLSTLILNLIRREVRSRVAAIAPFIDFRGDPYLISIPNCSERPNGQSRPYERQQHQYWIVEGYTHSSTLPTVGGLPTILIGI